MTHIFIGASCATPEVPCHSLEDWNRLFAALESDDPEAVMAVVNSTKPVLMPMASLKSAKGRKQKGQAKDMAVTARNVWAAYAAKHKAPPKRDPLKGVKVSAGPGGKHLPAFLPKRGRS